VTFGDPVAIVIDRFDPAKGWSGRQEIASGSVAPYPITVPALSLGDDGTAAVAWAASKAFRDAHSIAVARTFDGTSWGAPVTLNPDFRYVYTYRPLLATDSRGAFIASWQEYDAFGNQAYASRTTPGGSWSAPVLLNTPDVLPDGGGTSHEQLNPALAMSRTGDAVALLTDHDWKANTYALDMVTFSPQTGWSAPVQLDPSSAGTGSAQMDDCGNAAIAWISLPTQDAMSARRVRGGDWVTKRLGTVPSSAQWAILGVGPSGQTAVTYRSPDDHDQRANVLE